MFAIRAGDIEGVMGLLGPQFVGGAGAMCFLLAAEVAAMRTRGVDVSDVTAGSRRTPAGQLLQWKSAVLGPKNPLPLFFIEHVTPLAQRRTQAAAAGNHPNGVYKLERAYIVTHNAEAEAAVYANVLGMPKPELHKGTVVMSDMAIFEIGPTGLGVVQPYAPGPAADALARRGAGQRRTRHADDAAGHVWGVYRVCGSGITI